tara:strand:- start:912 stop:1310 length:399 start_codon:yes stop_codon:yes gene_type:complete
MSTLLTNTIQTSSGGPVALTGQAADVFYGRWNATGTYVINSSLNISSITDSTAGASLVTYTTNFADTSYAASMFCSNNGAVRAWQQMDGNALSAPSVYGTLTTSQLSGYTGNGATGLVDSQINTARAIGDLA